jgi:transposase
MSKNRKKYTPPEKAKIALETIQGNQTLGQITARYGVHATQVAEHIKTNLIHIYEASF